MLTIEQYNQAEAAAMRGMGLRSLQAYSPATFEDLNYPVRVSEEETLVRYVDTMHETFDGKYFDPGLFQYSVQEGEGLGRVADKVTELTTKSFGKTVRPWMAPFGAIEAFRSVVGFVEALDMKSPRIFEIGPGSAYLGALLIDRGYRYASMDNTQGFYLWQNRLYQALAGDDFQDWALLDDVESAWDQRVGHMGWWQWANLPGDTSFKADIVVCDHALGEFHPIALRHTVRVVRQILSGENGPKLFLFTSPGREHYSDINAIGRACQQAGMELLFFDGFFGFTVPESSCSKWSIKLDHAFKTHLRYQWKKITQPVRSNLGNSALAVLHGGAGPVGHKEGEKMLSGADIIKPVGDEQPFDYNFLKVAGYKTPLDFA